MPVYSAEQIAEMARKFRTTHILNVSLAAAGGKEGDLKLACQEADRALDALIARAQRDAIETAAGVADQVNSEDYGGVDEGSDYDIACKRIASRIRALLKDTP